jgi:hypothetical protein
VKFIFLLTALLINAAPLRAETSYSLKDLEALEKEKAYQEFFKHASDIRPSERNEYWKEMVANMAEGYLKSLKSKLILKREDFKTTQELALWPALAENEFFKIHRADLSLKWLEQCLSDDASPESACWRDLTDFWQSPKAFVDLVPKLLRLLKPYLQSSVPDPLNPKHRARSVVSEYFIVAPILFSELAELQCQKPEFQEILWTKLKTQWSSELSSTGLKQLLGTLAVNECWKKLVPTAQALLSRGGLNEDTRLGREFLKSLNALHSPFQEFYSLNYLLGFPLKGEDFNHSWALVQKLGKNVTKREVLMQQISTWERLPGEVFTQNDDTKKRAILRHLALNFPDYVDYYAHTCLNFYTGAKSYPQGNPALHCKEFFTTAKEIDSAIPRSMIQKFEEQF